MAPCWRSHLSADLATRAPLLSLRRLGRLLSWLCTGPGHKHRKGVTEKLAFGVDLVFGVEPVPGAHEAPDLHGDSGDRVGRVGAGLCIGLGLALAGLGLPGLALAG